MESYNLQWKKSAYKELRKLQKKDQAAIFKAVEGLLENPRKSGVIKLTDSENSYRLRVGNFRIVFVIFDKILTIEIIRIRDRKDVYR